MSLEAYIYKMMNKLGVSIEEWGSILQEKNDVLSPSKEIVQIYWGMYKF